MSLLWLNCAQIEDETIHKVSKIVEEESKRGFALAENTQFPKCAAHLVGGLVSEEVARAARTDAPALDVLGVRPHEVAIGPLVRDLGKTRNQAQAQAETI